MPEQYERGQAMSRWEHAHRALDEAEGVLRTAMEIVDPHPGTPPTVALPRPASVRAESPIMPELTTLQRERLADAASGLGFGRPENVTLSDLGYPRAIALFEGGKPDKIAAEAHVMVDDKAAKPKAIIFTASPHRQITEAEKASALKIDQINKAKDPSAPNILDDYGKAATEYDIAAGVARTLPGFMPLEQPEVLRAGYDIDDSFTVTERPTGQFEIIGYIAGTPVMLMKINRHELPDGKYERQPSNSDVIRIVDAVMRMRGDASSPVVQVTSGTYRPSRVLGVVLAGLSVERSVDVATYGGNLLNEVRGTPGVPAPTDQLPAELYVMAEQARRLRVALGLGPLEYGGPQVTPFSEEAVGTRPGRIGALAKWLLAHLGLRRD